MNRELLRAKIDEIKIPKKTISSKMGISRQSFYKKLSGKREFKVSEIDALCDILRLTTDEKNQIFFAE